MDRQTVYAGQVPLETDLLNTNRNVLIALGKTLSDMLGTSTYASGLGCVATAPASLSVQVNPGQLYALQNLDSTPYSSLAADTTHQIIKQGILLDAATFACAAPTTAGYSINYLIEAAYADVDSNPIVLAYYNATNPSQAFSGPGNNGQPSMTTRAGKVILTLKAGVAAATGTQVTPAVDSGCTGLWVVTVANGQSTITAANIAQYAGAPILPTSLLQSLITNNLEYGIDAGAANAVQATFPLPPTAIVDNQQFWVKVKTTNTGATTFTPNPGVIGALPVVGAAHQALQGNELVVNGRALFVYRADITSYVLESCTGASLQTSPATSLLHAPQMGQVTGVVGSARNLKMYVSVASTTATLTADEIVVESALGGVRGCVSNVNQSINVAGVNGIGAMDTGAAPTSGFVAIYEMFNPTTSAAGLIGVNATSIVAPNVYSNGHAPAGYTQSALVAVVPTDSSGRIVPLYLTGRAVKFGAATALASNTAPGSFTSLSLAGAFIPPNAIGVYFNFQYLSTTANSIMTFVVAGDSVNSIGVAIIGGTAVSPGQGNAQNAYVPIITAQTIYWRATNTAGTPTYNLNTTGYDF